MEPSGKAWNSIADRRLELGPSGEPEGAWQHWRLTRGEDGVAWLLLDRKDESANSLSSAVMAELDDILTKIEADPPKGLVIRSAKPAGFVVGADVHEFKDIAETEAIEEQIRKYNATLDRLAGLDMPSVAVIHGPCLGGGLELALACRHRIAIDGAKFGFPEVNLGLHPGLAGTARLTRLIDPIQAMTLMLTGRNAHTAKAKKLGIVDAVTEERHVKAAVAAAVKGNLSKKEGGVRATALNSWPVRQVAAKRMEAQAAKRAKKDHYPAPYALIDLWREHGGDAEAMKRAEGPSFARLLAGDTAQNLLRAFFLRESLKSATKAKHDFGHVHVIGAGTMGGDIAAWCAVQGLRVTLSDLDPKMIAGAVKRAAELGRRRHMNRAEVRDLLDRLIPDPEGGGVAHADIVIEAVPEKTDLKHQIYKTVEPRMKRDAVLATNTSSIPLETLATGLSRPGRLVGIHFFNPVARMQLVEIVSHDKTSKKTLSAANAFAGRIDRLPAAVKSAPGFLVNRALTPYLLEAMVMMDEGTAPETVDAAATDFGMPMGPVELADRVGLDICLEVAAMLRSSLDQPVPDVPDWLQKKVADGHLGRKTGRGLYDWPKGAPEKDKKAPTPDDNMADRLVLPLVNTCMACLREGVVADEDTLDAAMIFGTGVAPFRGGPMHYARTRGIDAVVGALQALADKHGERFAPDPGWQN